MIRPITTTDTDTLVALATETEVFKPAELVALREVLDDYHTHNAELGHRAVTLEREGSVVGFAYWAPASMTDRGWYLWWIAVAKETQGRGVGREVLDHIEHDIQARQGRILFVETSSLPHYDPTRRFYEKCGYDQATILRDFYADGDDMVVFSKRFGPP